MSRAIMRFTALMLGVALAVAAPTAAHAQAINPAQAAGLAQAALGIAFGVMFPAPQCGPHDAMPPPYRPTTPAYSPPPPLDQHANLDNDDDDSRPLRPLPPRPSTYSLQPQTRPDAQDESDQMTDVRARDSDQTADQPAMSEDGEQPAPPRTKRRPAQHNHQAQTTKPAQSSGQVAEIPSLPRGAQRSDRFAPQQ